MNSREASDKCPARPISPAKHCWALLYRHWLILNVFCSPQDCVLNDWMKNNLVFVFLHLDIYNFLHTSAAFSTAVPIWETRTKYQIASKKYQQQFIRNIPIAWSSETFTAVVVTGKGDGFASYALFLKLFAFQEKIMFQWICIHTRIIEKNVVLILQFLVGVSISYNYSRER